MKSKFVIWTIGLLTLVSCNELTCDFTYSPDQPAAGEVVSFSNKSTGADDYFWTFGDNGTSTSYSPSHIYRKPGTYTVTLQIIRNKVEKRTRTQHITIIDTIPTIACDTPTVYSFLPVKFSANIYNPWSKTVTYRWRMPKDAVILAGKSLDSSAVVCYFNQYETATEVGLDLTIGGSEFDLSYGFLPLHRNGVSVVYLDGNQAYEQFTYVINKQYAYQAPAPTSLEDNLEALKNEQDTLYLYGDKTYTVALVRSLLQEPITGFQVDRLMNKIYAYNDKGLWVSNMTGVHKRQLIDLPIRAIKVDGANNCLYWATSEGLLVNRLLKTNDNLEELSAQMVTNQHTSITKISVNSNLH